MSLFLGSDLCFFFRSAIFKLTGNFPLFQISMRSSKMPSVMDDDRKVVSPILEDRTLLHLFLHLLNENNPSALKTHFLCHKQI